MGDQFERHVAKQFPSISNGSDTLTGQSWDVIIGAEPGNGGGYSEPGSGKAVESGNGGSPSAEPMEAIRHAVGRLRSSFTAREAVERDLRSARAALREVAAVKRKLERTVEELSRIHSLLAEILD
jgi:hypothetical protein